MINFKSIAAATVAPAQLTVLAGSNSSGKSSLLQAALFFSQSTASRAVVINGDLVRLGEPGDVIREGTDDTSFEIEFKQRASEDEGEKAVACRVVLGHKGNELRPVEFLLSIGDRQILRAERTPSSALPLGNELRSLTVMNSKESGLPAESHVVLSGLYPTQFVYKADRNVFRADIDDFLESPMVMYKLDALQSILDVDMDYENEGLVDLAEKVHSHEIDEGIGDGVDEDAREELLTLYLDVVAPSGWVRETLRGASFGAPIRRHGPTRFRPQFQDLAELIGLLSLVGAEMDAFSAAVSYLGPLREDPRVAYPLGHTVDSLPVGEKGEFTAAYLERNSRKLVRYHSPENELSRSFLPVAVSEWCNYLQIATDVTVESKGKLGHQLVLTLGGSLRDPTAIGVGASQLLPVVVIVLGANEGQTILLEQPELHLHPKVQSRLADFVAWARPDVRILLETHSEYLITRLRLRVAQERLDPGRLVVKFVDQRPNDDQTELLHSEFHPLNINELGDFDYWPEGFFDSLDRDVVAIARAVNLQLTKREGDANATKDDN
ncbi:MAG: AAA family ATPase [Thermoleophilaceae bacterium]|nr:AAA family ATPase [Thermoleophilaceae bacterium]